ncbi:hypothetical protein BGZ70_004461, partial [Mortierella alpina]
MSTSDLTIQTSRPAADEEDSSQAMPLSPASVRSYQKNKAQKTKKPAAKGKPPLSEDDSEDDDEDEVSYESDKKSDEDDDEGEFDAAHLDPRLEALDGTTKLKTAAEKEQDEEEDEDEQDSSNEDEADSSEVGALGESVSALKLGADATHSSSSIGMGSAPSVLGPPGSTIFEGEVYQDPTSLGAISSASNVGQEERLQEPVKPHIALPCLVETAKNPARTRITLKYAGNDLIAPKSLEAEQVQKTSTRGRKNYM